MQQVWMSWENGMNSMVKAEAGKSHHLVFDTTNWIPDNLFVSHSKLEDAESGTCEVKWAFFPLSQIEREREGRSLQYITLCGRFHSIHRGWKRNRLICRCIFRNSNLVIFSFIIINDRSSYIFLILQLVLGSVSFMPPLQFVFWSLIQISGSLMRFYPLQLALDFFMQKAC